MFSLLSTSGAFFMFPLLFALAAVFITFGSVQLNTTAGAAANPQYGKADLVLLLAVIASIAGPAWMVYVMPFWWGALLVSIMAYVSATLFAYSHIGGGSDDVRQRPAQMPRYAYFLLATFATLSAWMALFQYWCADAMGWPPANLVNWLL